MADRTVQVSEETGRRLSALVSSSTPRITRKPQVRQPREPVVAGCTFKNDSGETIPAFACMKVTGGEYDDDLHRLIILVDKPDTTFARHYLVNGPFEVEDGTRGRAQDGLMVRVLYDTGSTPATGNGYGPKPDSWLVWQHYPETLLVAGEHDDEETLLGEWHDINRVFAEATENIGTGASGDGTILKGVAGSEATAGFTDVTWRNPWTAIVDGDQIMGINLHGQWYWCKPGEGTGDFCHLNGNAVADIPALSAISALDYIIGVEDGCFVLVPTSTCP